MVKIPGYAHGPLADGTAFLDEPLFWPCHLASSLWGDETQELALGADLDAALELHQDLSRADRLPVFTVRLPSGCAIHVVHRNLDGDMGVDYLFTHPARPEAATFTVDDGHFLGPGLCWPELEAAARQEAHEGVTDPDARLLLLLPALGDAHVPEHATARLATALGALTAVEESDALAPLLLRHQGQWSPARWYSSGGVRLCDGPHSFRNPAAPFALPPHERAAISEALAAPDAAP